MEMLSRISSRDSLNMIGEGVDVVKVAQSKSSWGNTLCLKAKEIHKRRKYHAAISSRSLVSFGHCRHPIVIGVRTCRM